MCPIYSKYEDGLRAAGQLGLTQKTAVGRPQAVPEPNNAAEPVEVKRHLACFPQQTMCF